MGNMILQNVSLSTNLRRLRNEAHLSQKLLVAKMNILGRPIEHTAYSKIEAGVRNIKVTDLVALQQIYKVDFGEFFKGIAPHE